MIAKDPFVSEFDAAIADRPNGEPDYRHAAPMAGHRAVTVVVEPWGEVPWTASFAAPDPGGRALSGLFGTASPTGLCVIERGTAFLGNVLAPAGFVPVDIKGPIVAAEESAAAGVLLLLTRWSITAVGDGVVLWSTSRIAIDGLRVDEIHEGWVRGVADPDDDEESHDFAVELATGAVIGGAGVS